MELVDPELGLGPLEQQQAREWYAPHHERELARVEALRDLAIDAIREHRTVVELDDALLDRLQVVDPALVDPPDSLELSVAVAATSASALDTGAFRLVVTPGVGADVAGCGLARFADLLGADAHAAWDELRHRARPRDGRLWAELVYFPRLPRAANVAVRPGVCDHEVVCGVLAGDAAHAIPVDELLVGVRGRRFCVRRMGDAAELALAEHHLLAPSHAPPPIRFLQHVARDGQVLLGPFDWGPAADFPFLPRLQRGRIVLAPARWRADRLGEEITEAGVRAWRESWGVPRHVYLAAGDQRLLLDLDAPAHAELLGHELRRAAGRSGLVVEEALPGPDDAWLPGPGGGHLAELVVPLVARPSGVRRRRVLATARAEPPELPVRTRPPGSDWLFLRLACLPILQDDLIVDHLAPFAEFARAARLAEDWFFIRYADPEPHLRLRLRGRPDVVREQLMPRACAWAAGLVRDGACSRFAIDTYDREIERYGGPDGVALAERIFGVDSRAVADLLPLSQHSPELDPPALAVAGVDGLLAGLGLSRADRLAWYRVHVRLGREDGRDYRAREVRLRRLLAGAAVGAPGGGAPLAVLTAHRRALEPLGAQMRSLGAAGRLGEPASELLRSLAHMHCNRLLGIDPRREERALQLARRVVESLERAPMV